MPDGIDLEQKNREEARWRMLRVVDAGRPIAVSEQIIWRVLADIKLSLSLITVRRELAYLRDLGLLELEGENGGNVVRKTDSQRRRRGRVQLPVTGGSRPPAQVLVRGGMKKKKKNENGDGILGRARKKRALKSDPHLRRAQGRLSDPLPYRERGRTERRKTSGAGADRSDSVQDVEDKTDAAGLEGRARPDAHRRHVA